MFDVYVNRRRDVLVIPRGLRVPLIGPGNWRKKRVVRSVSDAIETVVRKEGFYLQKLSKSEKLPTSIEWCPPSDAR